MSGRWVGKTVVAALLTVALVPITAAPPAAANGTVPPNNPPANIPPSPDFNQPQYCAQASRADNSSTCVQAVIDAINNARAQEGVGPMALPVHYASLTPDQQLLVGVDRERVDRGEPPITGITSELDTKAQQGADQNRDPDLTQPPSYAGNAWEGRSTFWDSVYQALAAVYYWMYEDGWGGSPQSTFNLDCTGPSDPNCWGHRDALLVQLPSGHASSFGGAVNFTSAGGQPSWTTVIMGTQGQPSGYTYTWSQALADSESVCSPAAASNPPTGKVSRIAGRDRDDTAIKVSQRQYPNGSANGVVLASDANFPDALAGGPLAAARQGPLLITHPSQLTSAVDAEIHRVLPSGLTVFILGGSVALDPSVDQTLSGEGYKTVRIAGDDRFATAAKIAEQLGGPATVLEATGLDFADALAAGPAASAAHAAILLTNGPHQAPATSAYLSGHSGGQHYAIGGPASQADPSARAIVGTDRYSTAVQVTGAFLSAPPMLAFATGTAFPDALSGGPGAAKSGGGLVLVPPCGPLPNSVANYVSGAKGSVGNGLLLGGTFAVGDDVLGELDQALA